MRKFAVSILSQTLLGFNNCFSVETEDGCNYRIVNFYLETLEKCIEKNIVGWPVKIRILSEHIAVINDYRIPDKYYNNEFCTVCCPEELLPITQQLLHERQIESGERKEQIIKIGSETIKIVSRIIK